MNLTINKQTLPKNIVARLSYIDILRGVCILLVVLVNFSQMNAPPWMHSIGTAFAQTPQDTFFGSMISLFLVKRIYPIFAFLFGISAALFYKKKQHSSAWRLTWMSRMLALCFLGILQLLLIWWGDVLTTYAFLGLILMLFIPLEKRPLAISAICVASLVLLCKATADYLGITTFDHTITYLEQTLGFWAMTKTRFINYDIYNLWGLKHPIQYTAWFCVYVGYYLEMFLMMICGLLVSKSNFFDHKKAMQMGFWVALSLLVGSSLLLQQFPESYAITFSLISAQSTLYMLIIVNWAKTCHPFLHRFFSFVGKNTLSVYLLGSGFASIVLYGYGFGLFGKIGSSTILLLYPLLVITILIIVGLWSKIKGQGPFEQWIRWFQIK
jgi:uncharacterized protein